jgi:hypothetical protein
VTYAVAAGNSNRSACNESPARVAEALTVAASTSADARASFSNYGSCVNIFAPGQGITSATSSSDTSTASYNGTSMASPHVAGAAALYLQANPSAAPAAVVSAMLSAATTGKLTNIGSGSPNRLLFVDSAAQPPAATATPTVTSTPTATSTQTVTSTPTATSTQGPTATATATGVATAIPTATATPPAGTCNEVVVNGDFEADATGWTESSSRGYQIICDGDECGASLAPYSGTVLAWLGGANRETASVAQNVSLPAGSKATLSYWYRISSEDRCGADYGNVYVKSGSKTYQVARHNLCQKSATAGWVNAKLDLSAYAGKSIRVTFQAKTNNTRISNLFIDNVSLMTGNSCSTGQGIEMFEVSEQEIEMAATEDTFSEDLLPQADLERRE